MKGSLCVEREKDTTKIYRARLETQFRVLNVPFRDEPDTNKKTNLVKESKNRKETRHHGVKLTKERIKRKKTIRDFYSFGSILWQNGNGKLKLDKFTYCSFCSQHWQKFPKQEKTQKNGVETVCGYQSLFNE